MQFQLENEQNLPAAEDVVVPKRKYLESRMRAQANYRKKFPEKYCKLQREFYERKKQDPVWKEHFNERAREYARNSYQKKKEEKLALGIVIKRGRPRKTEFIEKIEENLENL